ncbi:MAG TPA: hypothetical protein VK995_04405 [Oceanipulchritudo sp.]|nr:hypothetical protein [Oceanipulchritudo sp.]
MPLPIPEGTPAVVFDSKAIPSQQDQDEDDQPKLKLRKILTPLSPHLKAQLTQGDDGKERKDPRLEIPRAVPMEIEPELPPPPPEQKMTAPTGPGFDQPLPDPVADAQAQETEAEPLEEPENKGEVEGEIEAGGAKEAIRSFSFRRISKLLAPVALAIAGLFIVNYLFDPFGLQLEPIKPMSSPLLPKGDSRNEQTNAPQKISGIDLYVMLDKQSLDEYLKSLQNQKIYPSDDPVGIFIGAAFIPLGSSVNPSFGLILKGIEKTEAVLEDEYLTEYRIALR